MFSNLTPITKNIIIACIIIYVASIVLPGLYNYLPAYYPFSQNFHSWQIITHMFMHARLGDGAGILHIAFNLMTLWSFGPILEHVLGPKRFTILYLLSGLGAFGLFSLYNIYEVNLLTNQLTEMGVNVAEIFHKANVLDMDSLTYSYKTVEEGKLQLELYQNLLSPMLGASGAIFGVIAAFTTLFPNAEISLMFIPIPIKAKVLLPIIIVISLYLQFSGGMSGIAHLAHVGGALVGFILASIWKRESFRIN